MKKTLLALAVVAASGSAFAQSATLSGEYAFGYESKKIGGVKTAGFGTDTAAIKLVATEDLGGGLKASAQVSLGGMHRDGAGTGENASLTLAGGFGTIGMGTVETDDGLRRATAGAPGYNLDGEVHTKDSNIDFISYTSPQLAPGLTVGVGYVDRGATAGTGLAEGTTGTATAQPSITANVAYKTGPIDARFDVTSWTRKNQADVTSNTTKQRFRISGNYNLGVAKLGLGYAQTERTTGVKVKDLVAGVSAGFGATTVGLVYEQRDISGTKTKGTTVGAAYSLSKRTSLNAHYAQWKVDGAATTNNAFRVLAVHAF